jgi:plasmid replication initiation protein
VLNVIKNPRIYVKLDLIIIRGLESKHSVALYELMKDYQNLNRYRCEIGNFRKLMGVEDGQYSIFTMFKKRVVDKAVAEINEKTDIQLSFDLEREGRKVTALTFNVKNKPKKLTSHSDQLDGKVTERLKQL